MNTRTKLIGTIVVGAALLAPVAQGSVDDRAGVRGPGGIAALQSAAANHPDNRTVRGAGGIAALQTPAASHPDSRVDARGPGAVGSPGNVAAFHPDNRAVRGPGAVSTVVVQPSSTGFDWGDALIGGIGGLGAALLLTGCLFLLMSQRSKTRLA